MKKTLPLYAFYLAVQRVGIFAAMVALVLIVACDNGGISSPVSPAPPPPTANQAAISVSITPTFLFGEESGNAEFPWQVAFNVVVSETAGLGVNVNFINLEDTEGEWTQNYGAKWVIARAGTNHINARGTLTIPFVIRYYGLLGTSWFGADVKVDCTDDKGNHIVGTAKLLAV